MSALSNFFNPETIISLFALLFAITVHEAAHAWTALKKGDPTAAGMGRVSLNPLAHIDLFGTIILPIMLIIAGLPAFGWAKPVIVDPRNLRRPRHDNLWISLAGPAANLSTAAVSLALILAIKFLSPGSIVFLARYLSRQPVGAQPLGILTLILFYFVFVNCYLAAFNLIPVPPLDGSGVLSGLLSSKAAATYGRLRPFPEGIIIIVVLISIGVLNWITQPILKLVSFLMFS
jgi:Zn-dependent protease